MYTAIISLLCFLVFLVPRTLAATPDVQAGSFHSVILKADGKVWGCGSNHWGQSGDGTTVSHSTPRQLMSGVSSVAAGGFHSIFVKADGSAWTTGLNLAGQLGTGNHTDDFLSVPVRVMEDVQQAAAGRMHSIFLKTDGSAWAAGGNSYGQLGNGSNDDQHSPVRVMEDVRSASSKEFHTLFLKTDGTVWATGNNAGGQLGNGSWDYTNLPLPSLVSGVRAIATGERHSLFLKGDGTVWACGANDYGQLGTGSVSGAHATPVQVMSGVKEIAAGYNHSLFLKEDGTLWSCGLNDYGQAGTGNTVTQSAPVQIQAGVYRMTGGFSHTIMALTDGSMLSCGNNSSGQLGDGTATPRRTSPATMAISSIFSELPVILTQPADQTVMRGATVTLKIEVSGAAPLSFQWRRGDRELFAGSVMVLHTIQPEQAGDYTCTVTNHSGSVTSRVARVTVNVPPEISRQPADVTSGLGQDVSFSVGAAGTGPLEYQWMKGGAEIPGATAPVLQLAEVEIPDIGEYSCRVSSPFGSETSRAARLEVLLPPNILVHPESRALPTGADYRLHAAATGTGVLTYQWAKDGKNLSGKYDHFLQLTAVEAKDAGSYVCLVSDGYNTSWSRPAIITVQDLTAITAEPQAAEVYEGMTARLEIAASGGAPLAYQWLHGENVIPGADGPILLIPAVSPAAAGSYHCRVSNAVGVAVSATAELTILPHPADLWLAEAFPGNTEDPEISGWEADPDGDGVPNLLEYAFNLQPLTAGTAEMTWGSGTSGMPAAQTQVTTPEEPPVLSVQYLRRRSAARQGILYIVEYSASLEGGAWAAAGTENVEPVNADWERVTVTDSQPAAAADGFRFARVRVEILAD